MAGYTFTSVTLTGDGEPEAITGGRVSWNLLPLLGVRATSGRGFTAAEDDVRGDRQEVMLGEALWRRRFGADPGLVGRGVTLDGRSFTVVGVAPHPERILRLILRQSLARTLVGLGLGTVAAMGLTHAMRAVQYEVGPFDPVSYATVAGVLLAVSATATVVPGRRATRVDPRVAFTAE